MENYASHTKFLTGSYLGLLRAGGAQHHRQLLAFFGWAAVDSAFWAQGLNVVADFIDRLEQYDASSSER